MLTLKRDNIVYVFGPDLKNYLPTDRVDIKIGKSGNNDINFSQRLSEHRRHCPRDIVLGKFPTTQLDTNNPDDVIRKKLCADFPAKFGCTRSEGRDVLQLVLVSDVPFLLEQVARSINFADTGSSHKDNFPMRQEQIDCVEKTYSFFIDPANAGREFLWDCKMRFGKTFTFYELATKLDTNLVLILTNRPTDTKQAWIDGMDHVDFPNYVFIDSSKYDTPILPDPNKRTIIFASLQDFARLPNGSLKPKFQHFPNLPFDLLGKDEYHIGFETDNTKEAVALLTCKYVVNLSGTPFRARLDGRFEEDAIFTWSYIDEQRARSEEIDALGGADRAEQEGQYFWLSTMKVYTILLSPELYDDSEQFTEEEGFNFEKLLKTHMSNEHTLFLNDAAVDHLLHSMSHGTVMPYSKQAQVRYDGSNERGYKAINLKHTLWYLPGVAAVKLLADKLKKQSVFKDYDIIQAADDNDGEGKDTARLVKDRIALIETGGNYKKYKGTITLTCGKLSHGVSIPEWGAVFNLSDMTSAQLYFQLIFRGQTPWKGNKYECYVFDFKPNRTLQCMYDAAQVSSGTSDPVPYLTEMLNVFNVLSYEGTMFKHVDASDLISKLESGWGRSTSLIGLQTLLSELPFDLNVDPDLGEELDDIEDGVSNKSPKEVEVSSNPDVPNGKTSTKSKDDDGETDTGSDPSDDDQGNTPILSDERKKLRIKSAMKALPLYWLLIQARSCDELIDVLSRDSGKCKTITGMPARSVRKLLSNQSVIKQQTITEGLVRFRSLEARDNVDFQKEVKE